MVSDLKLSTTNVKYLGADLSQTTLQEVLKSTDFNVNEPSVVVIEGLLQQISQEGVDQLMQSVSAISAKGSLVTYDFVDKCILNATCKNINKLVQKAVPLVFKTIGEPWKSGFDPDLQKDQLNKDSFDLTEYISFFDAHDKLNVQEYHGSVYFGIMNFVIATKQ